MPGGASNFLPRDVHVFCLLADRFYGNANPKGSQLLKRSGFLEGECNEQGRCIHGHKAHEVFCKGPQFFFLIFLEEIRRKK